jgi:hypothetical protein
MLKAGIDTVTCIFNTIGINQLHSSGARSDATGYRGAAGNAGAAHVSETNIPAASFAALCIDAPGS